MSQTQQHKHGKLAILASIAVLTASIGALSGCGGSSPPKATPTQAQTPAQRNAEVVEGVQTRGKQVQRATHGSGLHPSSSQLTLGHNVQRARHPAGTSSDAEGNTRVTQPNPCALVKLPEAQSITGGLIAGQVKAPLGPTCIYRLNHSKSYITLVVESMNFSQITHELAARRPILVGGRRAYCGKLGAQMLFVPLADGRLLNVTAPCAIAQQFAARALTRLVS